MLVVYGDVHCIIDDGDAHNGVDDYCQTFSPNYQLLVMVVMVYYDGHCIIGDGDAHNGSCQTFSPNCAVKLPMSPSIRGKPVHVFAEDSLLILSYYYLQQRSTSFLGPILWSLLREF